MPSQYSLEARTFLCTVLPVPCPRSHREIPCSEFSVRPFPLFSEMRKRASRPTVNLGSMLCRLVASLCLVVAARASHCYNYDTCTTCVGNSVGAPCAWCNDGCQMASDVCAAALFNRPRPDAAQRCEAGAQPTSRPQASTSSARSRARFERIQRRGTTASPSPT